MNTYTTQLLRYVNHISNYNIPAFLGMNPGDKHIVSDHSARAEVKKQQLASTPLVTTPFRFGGPHEKSNEDTEAATKGEGPSNTGHREPIM